MDEAAAIIGDMKAMNAINPLDYQKLVYHWCYKLGAPFPVEDSEEYSDGWIGLLKAIRTFDFSKSKPVPGKPHPFAGFASRGIKTAILNRRRADRAQRRGGSGQAKKAFAPSILPFSVIWANDRVLLQKEGFDLSDAKESFLAHLERKDYCFRLLECLSEREQGMAWDFWAEEHRQKEIAKKYQLSRKWINKSVDKVLIQLQKQASLLR